MEYHAPRSLTEVTDLLANAGGRAKLMAGGTDLLAQVNKSGHWPAVLVDVKHVPELTALRWLSGGEWSIGAAVTGARLRDSVEFAGAWPGIAEAMGLLGATQTQNRATVGGNICNASPAADLVPTLVAARATCRLVGADSERCVPIEEVIIAPGKTCLRADEVLVEIRLPARAASAADAYLRATPRARMDIAIASAAVNLALDSAGRVSECHVALGGVFPVPVMAGSAARTLTGWSSEEDSDTMARFKRQVSAACRPIDDARSTAEYRNEVIGVLAARAARLAWSRAAG